MQKSPESVNWVSLIWDIYMNVEGRSGVTNIGINIYCDCLWCSLNFPVIWFLPTSPGSFWSKFTKDSFKVSSTLTFPVTLFLIQSGFHLCIPKAPNIYINNPMLMKWSVLPLVHQPHCTIFKRSYAKELMLLNCGVGEDSWESLGLQGDPTSPFWRSALGFLWKEWC